MSAGVIPLIPVPKVSTVATPLDATSLEATPCEALEAPSAPDKPSKPTKPPPQIIEYDPQEIYILEKRFQRLHRDSARLLAKSQRYKVTSIRIKLVIVMFSLATSYLTAVSGINEVVKTYLAAAFSLLSAILSGATTIKNFSADSARMYTGFMEYQQKASSIEPIFHHFRGTIPYSELLESIDTLLTKYEMDVDKTYDEKVANAEKRCVYIFEVMEETIKRKNDGTMPEWYNRKRLMESHLNKYVVQPQSVAAEATVPPSVPPPSFVSRIVSRCRKAPAVIVTSAPPEV